MIAAARANIASSGRITAKELHMSAHRMLSALVLCCVLSACGGNQDEAREPMPVKDTVFGDTVGTMDKARAVEETTMQHKENLDRAMEDAESAH
jgi:hypothetical protein